MNTAEHTKFTHLIFFFNDTATTEIYTLSLHDALPIFPRRDNRPRRFAHSSIRSVPPWEDRKSTRLNSSHSSISYAFFCLKKKKTNSKNFNLKKKKQLNNTKKP